MLTGSESSHLEGVSSPLAENNLENASADPDNERERIGKEVLENIDGLRVRNSAIEIVEELHEYVDIKQHANVLLAFIVTGVILAVSSIVPHALSETYAYQ